MSARFGIGDISPMVAGGRYPAKAVIGEHIPVTATVWREGHAALAVDLVWREQGRRGRHRVPMALVDEGLDRWHAVIIPGTLGLLSFHIEAWSDPWRTWRNAVTAKLAAANDHASPGNALAGLANDHATPVNAPAGLANDLEAGARLLDRAAGRAGRPGGTGRVRLREAAAALRDAEADLLSRAGPALDPAVDQIMVDWPLRELCASGPALRLRVERPLALTGAWYELFPRSTGGRDEQGVPVHGTFASTIAALPRIAAMGFDVVYLPPIHPIGETHRKGRNNALAAGPEDVGSPWAIGSWSGGHDGIHKSLGTEADFQALVVGAREAGLEIALDLALQCSPDHPWVRDHPEWFSRHPDGSVAFAENPPKTYEDIYPLNFDADPEGLRTEVLRILRHWIALGVRTFRVDNPHTKPPGFWHDLIEEVLRTCPEAVFLAEAFTRPAVMHGLAALGFSQSYTYFTWRTGKRELEAYLTELVATADCLRPNLWVNTPDILPEHLAGAPEEMFAIRAALAATLGPSWGMYSGYELFENTPVEQGSTEYLDSEKYELRPRDFAEARRLGRSLEGWISRLNRLRAAHPALGQLRTLRFHDIDNDNLIAYSKADRASGDTVLVVVTLDPGSPQRGRLRLDAAAPGIPGGTSLTVRDEFTGRRRHWNRPPLIRIDPTVSVARVFSVESR